MIFAEVVTAIGKYACARWVIAQNFTFKWSITDRRFGLDIESDVSKMRLITVNPAVDLDASGTVESNIIAVVSRIRGLIYGATLPVFSQVDVLAMIAREVERFFDTYIEISGDKLTLHARDNHTICTPVPIPSRIGQAYDINTHHSSPFNIFWHRVLDQHNEFVVFSRGVFGAEYHMTLEFRGFGCAFTGRAGIYVVIYDPYRESADSVQWNLTPSSARPYPTSASHGYVGIDDVKNADQWGVHIVIASARFPARYRDLIVMQAARVIRIFANPNFDNRCVDVEMEAAFGSQYVRANVSGSGVF